MMKASTDLERPYVLPFRRQLLICVGPHCKERGMDEAQVRRLGRRLIHAGLLELGPKCVKPTRVHCLGVCAAGPIVCVYPESVWYHGMAGAALDRMVDEHLAADQPVDALIFHRGPTSQRPPDAA